MTSRKAPDHSASEVAAAGAVEAAVVEVAEGRN
jgi:hypothetical protein